MRNLLNKGCIKHTSQQNVSELTKQNGPKLHSKRDLVVKPYAQLGGDGGADAPPFDKLLIGTLLKRGEAPPSCVIMEKNVYEIELKK